MGNQPVDIRLFQAVVFQRFIHDPSQGVNRHLEDFVSPHLDVGGCLRHFKKRSIISVCMQMSGEYARLIAGLQHHGTGPISKQNTSSPVLPIEYPRKGFSTHHQCTACTATADKIISHRKRVDKAGADCLNIKSWATMDIQPALKQAGGAGKYLIRRCRSHDDEIDILVTLFCRLHGEASGLFRQVAGGFIRLGYMPFDDTRPVLDPLIGSVHDLLQIMVGHHRFRQVAAGTDNSRISHTSAFFSSCAVTRCPIRSETLV